MVRVVKIAVAGILWLVPVLILSLAFHYGWRDVWSAVRIPSYEPKFMDLRVITGGVATFRSGGNPLVANPHDPWSHPLNYPRIWLYIFSTLGITNANISIAGVAFCGFYLTCMSVLILRARHVLDAIILLIAGLSLSPLLGIERGNIDLVIFSLVFLGCVASARALKLSAFAAAAVLKIYPLAAMAADIIRRPARKRAAPLLLFALVLASFAFQWRDIKAISHTTPISGSMSYGSLSLKQEFDEDWRPLLGSHMPGTWAVVLACWAAGALAAAGAWNGLLPFDQSILNSAAGEMFSIFGAIYVFSFAVGSNWAYRLIFLLPTLPLALEMSRRPRYRRFGVLYVGLVLLAENAFGLKYVDGTMLTHLATFSLFVAVIMILTQQGKWALLERAPQSQPTAVEASPRVREAQLT